MGSKGRSKGDSLGHGAFYTPDESGEGGIPETVAPEQTLAEQLEELPHDELVRIVETMEEDMRNASAAMDFEEAARLRDAVVQIRAMLEGASEDETIERFTFAGPQGSTFASGRKRRVHGLRIANRPRVPCGARGLCLLRTGIRALEVCNQASAQRMPSAAALMMPPAYPAPSPQG